MRRLTRALIVVGVVLACGCASRAARLEQARLAFYAGDLSRADELLGERLERQGYDADVARLDRAMVLLAQGQPRMAERLLRETRDRLDHQQQTDLGEEAVSMITDDTRVAYSGEPYERIVLRSMLALSNLLHDGGDALAYSLQIEAEQQRVAQVASPPPRETGIALGAYIQGMLREEMPGSLHDAMRCYERVVLWEPRFASARTDVLRTRDGVHSARGHGVVYVFALLGRGPQKVSTMEVPTTAALMIAEHLLASRDEILPPVVAPVKVPRIVVSPDRAGTVLVGVDDRITGRTETILDVAEHAVRRHEEEYDRIVARAVVRRVIKRGIVAAGEAALGADQHPASHVAAHVGRLVWEATENADTRCWGLLPSTVQVLRVELPAGAHQLQLTAARHDVPVGSTAYIDIDVQDGRNTYVLAQIPDTHVIGEVLVR